MNEKNECKELKKENEELKKENEFLLGMIYENTVFMCNYDQETGLYDTMANSSIADNVWVLNKYGLVEIVEVRSHRWLVFRFKNKGDEK